MLSLAARKDLIISGYIRRINAKHSMTIDADICSVLYAFYEQYTDQWSANWSNKLIDIADTNTISVDRAKKSLQLFCTAFGDHIVENGQCHTWKFKIIGRIYYPYCGVIENDINRFKAFESRWRWCEGINGYVLNGKCKYIRGSSGTDVLVGDDADQLGFDGDTVEMKLDLTENQSSISFVVNNKDLGVIYDNVPKSCAYRMAVCVHQAEKGAKIQIL